MKKLLSSISALLLFVLLVLPTSVSAQQQNVTISKDQIINQNPYFAAGDKVEINGTVNGDVYAAGGSINVNGTVNGDILAAGGSINIAGHVTKNVRVAGGEITITGKVDGNTSIAGGTLNFTGDSALKGYLVAAGGNISLMGPINGNTSIAGGQIFVDSALGGKLDAATGILKLGPAAKVKGDVNYWSDQDLTVDQQATISGKTIKHTPPVKFDNHQPAKTVEDFSRGANTGLKIIGTLTLLVLGFLFLKLFPNFMEKTTENIQSSPWKSLGWGFLLIILTPFAILFLFITIIGIPLAFILIALYGIYLYVAKIFVILWAGRAIAPKSTPFVSLLIGLGIYLIVSSIFIVNAIAGFIITLFGLGAYFLTARNYWQASRKAKLL